jgi:hypothetical protein
VTFSAAPNNRFFQRAQRIQVLEGALAKAPGVISTFSTVTLIPQLGPEATVSELILMRYALERRRDQLLGRGHLLADDAAETWRITLRSNLFGGVPRDELMRGVRAEVDRVVSGWDPDQRPSVVYTGGSEIFYETQHDVLIDFTQSLLLAYGLILALMAFALRSLRGGMLSMLSNIVPCLAVFGLLGWIDRGIDIGMTVAGCIALGIAVDNTAHLLLLYREHLGRLGDGSDDSRLEALQTTYRQSSTAVFQSGVICGLSMLPYMFSPMLYLSRFGLLMSALMLAAMFCDLLLTPALIAVRWGTVFDGAASPARSIGLESTGSTTQ